MLAEHLRLCDFNQLAFFQKGESLIHGSTLVPRVGNCQDLLREGKEILEELKHLGVKRSQLTRTINSEESMKLLCLKSKISNVGFS